MFNFLKILCIIFSKKCVLTFFQVEEEKEIKVNHELDLVENLSLVNINQVLNQGTPARYIDNIRNCKNVSPLDSGFESSCIHFSNCSELNEVI